MVSREERVRSTKYTNCEQSLSVPQNQSRKHKNRAAKQRASRRETANREDCGVRKGGERDCNGPFINVYPRHAGD